jgi:integration host factor subunit alpha
LLIDSDPSRAEADSLAALSDADTVTKAELAEILYERVGLNKREAKDVVDAFFAEIRDKPQRPGRNPKTGEPIPISARRVVTFHASQKLKACVEGRQRPLDSEGDEDL